MRGTPLQPANEVNGAINARVAGVLARGMSQGREQRFGSASAMRAAMKGEDGTQSAGDRTEAATVIFAGSSAATVVAEPQSPPTAAVRGETTVVQTPKRSGLRPWAIVVAAVVLIGVGFGVFYAIQNRNGTTAVSTPTPSPSPASTPVDVAADPDPTPASGGSADEAALEKSTEAATKKNEKGVKETKLAPADRVVVTDKPKPSPPLIGNPTWNAPQAPETPGTGPADNSLFPRRTGTRVRNLPDGSRIIINPDGTRVMIMADGTRRVLPPAPRPRRKY